MRHSQLTSLLLLAALFVHCRPAAAQPSGTLTGKVTLAGQGTPLHNVTITIGRLGRTAESDHDGAFEIRGLPPGTYNVTAHLHQLSDITRQVEIRSGETTEVKFEMSFRPVRDSITVTATEREQTTFEAFQAVSSLDSVELTQKSQPSLGEVLEGLPGVGKRSFGPGSSRPVIRGFDADRVLIMQDGLPTGTLSSQSGDHAESLDASTLERVEVVKGPATLLYGSNAIGGVVNAITGHHLSHSHPHQGVTGFITGFGGTTNNQGGGAGGFEAGIKNWRLWGSGGGQRTGDYNTPIGVIDNSRARVSNTTGGFGWANGRGFFDAGYRYDEGRYGVPFVGEFHGDHDDDDHDHDHEARSTRTALLAQAKSRTRAADDHQHDEEPHEDISLAFRRHNLRTSAGARGIGTFIDGVRFSLNYSDWEHKELAEDQVETLFQNKTFVYRGVFEQQRKGPWLGTFGFQGMHRDYEVIGEEALAPPVKQDGIAIFGLQELDFERVRFQLGGRLEHNRYLVDSEDLDNRSFTGFSGAAGIYVPLWRNGAFVTNYTHSFRAPALEELYNFGPHVGNLTFEIGNPNLKAERANGVDFALRHRAGRVRGEVNFFYYGISDFVFLAPTGEVEDGLTEAEFAQGDSRFYGTEANLDFGLNRFVWLNLGLDYVNAELTETRSPLPRITPLRGRAGLDFRFNGLSVRPMLRMAGRQDRIFATETPTAGYAVFDVNATYTLPRQHSAHIFGVNFFNANNRLYRNHLSFIKDLAPEIGRGVRFTYTMRFF
jgi:iron complex outermembrane receptor protein